MYSLLSEKNGCYETRARDEVNCSSMQHNSQHRVASVPEVIFFTLSRLKVEGKVHDPYIGDIRNKKK